MIGIWLRVALTAIWRTKIRSLLAMLGVVIGVASRIGMIAATSNCLLGVIAGVSLLIGGIGIMCAMLIGVTERTGEIGIRRVIGARARDVLMQFLVEAIVLALIGGLIGVVLGVGGTLLWVHWLGLPVVISGQVVLLAFTIAVMIGGVFGFMPARKAARLDPIDALRRE